MKKAPMVATHIGRVVAHILPDGSRDYQFIPIDAPNQRYRLTRMPLELASVDDGTVDLRRLEGRVVSVTGRRTDAGWITNVISLQAGPERPAVARLAMHDAMARPA